MITGIVSGEGEVRAGAGFALERTGPGVYAIRFFESFEDAPAVLATPSEAGRSVAATSSAGGAEISVTDHNGVRMDGGFSFTAMAAG
jgi:hypothetical protein